MKEGSAAASAGPLKRLLLLNNVAAAAERERERKRRQARIVKMGPGSDGQALTHSLRKKG